MAETKRSPGMHEAADLSLPLCTLVSCALVRRDGHWCWRSAISIQPVCFWQPSGWNFQKEDVLFKSRSWTKIKTHSWAGRSRSGLGGIIWESCCSNLSRFSLLKYCGFLLPMSNTWSFFIKRPYTFCLEGWGRCISLLWLANFYLNI